MCRNEKHPAPDNNRLLEDNRQVRKKVKQYNKKGRLKRVIAVLGVFVLLFTLNQLTFEADTLQRKATCGYTAHVHTRACEGEDGTLECGLEEHQHTDACYQQRPAEPEPTVIDEYVDLDGQVVLASPMEDADIASETVDESVSETTLELGDATSAEGDADNGLEAEYDLDALYDGEAVPDAPAQADDPGLSGEAPEGDAEKEYSVAGETLVFLSDVLKGTGISAADITAVGEIQDSEFVEDHIGIEPVEGVKDEYVLKTVRSFDRIQLGIATEDAIETVWLTDGVAVEPADDAPTPETDEAADAPEEDGAAENVTAEGQPDEEDATVTDQIPNSNENEITETEQKQTEVADLQTEVGAQDIEDEPVEDDQAEDAPAEDDQIEDEPDGDAPEGDEAASAGQYDAAMRRVDLDFTDYIAAEAHTVYLYDEAMHAVLVNVSEIAEADGVAVSFADEAQEDAPDEAEETGEAPDGAAEAGEAPEEPAEVDGGVVAQAEVAGETIGVLIITGDGEYALNGAVYTVSGLALPSDSAPDGEGAITGEETGDGDAPADAEDAPEDADAPEPESVSESILVGYKLEYDLADTEQYPLSLRALMDRAEPVYEEREVTVEAGPADAPAEGDAEAAETSAGDGNAAGDAATAAEEGAEEAAVEAPAEETAEGGDEATEEAVEGDEVAEEAVEDGDEASEEAVEGGDEAADGAGSVEYDAAVLAVEAVDGDWLVTPAADFERTVITVGMYEIALLNGRAAETYPAQTFEGATEYVTVHVEAPDGAFPDGTTMRLEDVVDEATLDKLGEPVAEGFNEVQRVHAVDITFFDRDGVEIEPLLPISVAMGVRETAEDEQTTVVHMNSAGNAEVVEAASMTDAAATSLAEDAAQAAGEQSEEETVAETAVSFTADAFSIYAVVVSKTLETKYLTSAGESYKITMTYTEEAQIPDGATLAVRELAGEEAQAYLEKTEASLSGNRMVTSAQFFDIKIMNGEAEVQPAAPVEVKIEQIAQAAGASDVAEDAEQAAGEADGQADGQAAGEADAAEEAAEEAAGEAGEDADGQDGHLIVDGDPVVGAVHFAEDGDDPQPVKARETEDSVIFTANSFSVYGVVYTVDFYYGNYEWHIPGEGHITLSELFSALHIDADAAQAAEVAFTSPELVAVERIEADWLLTSLEPFTTHETLSVTMTDNTVYQIRVEDAAAYHYMARFSDKQYGYFTNTNYNGALFWTYTGTENYILVYDVKKTGDRIVSFKTKLDGRNVLDYDVRANSVDGGHFAMWVKVQPDGTITRINGDVLSKANRGAVSDTTFVAYTVQNGVKIVVVEPYNGGMGTVTKGKTISDDGSGEYPTFYYTTDKKTVSNGETRDAFFRATANSGYYFKGWYDDQDNLIETASDYVVSKANTDLLLHAVFEVLPKYTLVPNKITYNGQYVDAGYFTKEWSDFPQTIPSNTAQDGDKVNDHAQVSKNMDITPHATYSDYVFCCWLRDDGVSPETRSVTKLNKNNVLERDTSYIGFFKPSGEYLIRVNYPAEGGGTSESDDISQWKIRSVSVGEPNPRTFYYYFTSDTQHDNGSDVAIIANPSEGWEFDGWYHNGKELISTNRVQNIAELKEKGRDLNLTPVFIPKRNNFRVWFDGSDGVGGGSHSKGNNTFYTRIDSGNNLHGANSIYTSVPKIDPNGSAPYAQITLPSASDRRFQAPQSVGDNKYELKGWYDVYTGQYYQPGETVTITADSVFYADWFPSSYDIGQNSDVAYDNDTSSFITTRVFDYNNLFNMDSIHMDKGQSVIPAPADENSYGWGEYNREYWYMNGDSNDFIFMSTVSDQGRSLNPYGRDEKNRNQEKGTNGNYYTAIVQPRLLKSALKSKLFSPENGLGKRYVGTGNCLYTYDDATGYYFYNSDRNAASYNKSAGRFYVYDYTNKTNKSNGGDNTDFLPFNYGAATFSESLGAPNYWFGMSSEIKFYLPNTIGASGGNHSTKDDEMIYKFAGDDDVWVYVDDKLVLDMGGIHGKVYGEINFSTGDWKVVGEGMEKTSTGDIEIIGYTGSEGSIIASGTLQQKEITEAGDHTLTLYYLERGASQSNCAIYFNLAPKYGLKIEKKDKDSSDRLSGAEFTVYTDAQCKTIDTRIRDTVSGEASKLVTDENGYANCTGLEAENTYYIKETAAPVGYALSSDVIALTLTNDGGNVTVSATCTNKNGGSGSLLSGSPTISEPSRGEYLIRIAAENKKLSLKLRKRETGKDNTKVAGAKFQIYTLSAYNDNGAALDRSWLSPNMTTDTFDSTTTDSVLVSNGDGNFYLGRLPDGEYVLVEIEAPIGYYIPAGQDAHRIKVEHGELYRWTGSAYERQNTDSSHQFYNFYIDNPRETLSHTVTKTWSGFAIPEGYKARVTYVLHRKTAGADEEIVTGQTKAVVYTSTDGTTPAVWTDLPKYSAANALYTYWATEQKVELLPSGVANDAAASTAGIVELESGFFSVTGKTAEDSIPGQSGSTQTLTNTVPTATYTAGKDWATYLADKTKGALTPPAGTTVVFQLKQYKQGMNTPEETELSSITLNGLKDVTDTPGTGEELLSDTSNTAEAKEGSAWNANWSNLRKYYWNSATHSFREYNYDVEEAQFTYGNITYTVEKQQDGSYKILTGTPGVETHLWTASKGNNHAFTNTLELTDFEFTKQWWDNIESIHNGWPTYVNASGDTVDATITVRLSRHLVYNNNDFSPEADSYTLDLPGLHRNMENMTATGSDGSAVTVRAVEESVEIGDRSVTVCKFVISGLPKKGSMQINGETKTGKWRYFVSEIACEAGPGALYSQTYLSGIASNPPRDHNTDSTGVIRNTKEQTFELPSTGGPGTTRLYLLGSALAVLAAVLSIIKRRKGDAE